MPIAVRPRPLRPGDRIRVVAPAGPPDPAALDRGIDVLRGLGLVVEEAEHVRDGFGYFSATDDDRLRDLSAAFADPGVRGVFASRGGYGTQRIVDRFDLSLVRDDPKVFVGFSDLTTLMGRLWNETGLITFYGPMATWQDARLGEASAEALRRAIMSTAPVVLSVDPSEPSAGIGVPGRATGPLLGGNLAMLQASIGTPDLPDLHGGILVFEDVNEPAYKYDRMLTHLRRSGALDGVAGVAVGHLTNAQTRAGHWTAAEAVQDRLAGLGVPVLGGLRIGHGLDQETVPLGAEATIDTAAGTLTVASGVAPARTPAATAA
jgi:muramoyltetrapeptide carboxypeptidase